MNSDPFDYFSAIMESQGVAVSTVTDGVVLSFKRTWLEDLLKKVPKDTITIFIKQAKELDS